MGFVIITHICCYREKQPWTDTVSAKKHGSIPVKLYLLKDVAGWIWPLGLSLPSPDLEEKNNWAYSNLCGVPAKQRMLNGVYNSHFAGIVHAPLVQPLEKWDRVCVLVTYTTIPLDNVHLSLSYSHILGLITVYQAWPQTPAPLSRPTRTQPDLWYTKETYPSLASHPRLKIFFSLLSHLISSTKCKFYFSHSFTSMKLYVSQGDHWTLNEFQNLIELMWQWVLIV